MPRFLFSALIAAALPLLTATTAAAQTRCAAASQAAVSATLQQVNSVRNQAGVGRLRVNDTLMRAAQLHACDMAAAGRMSHSGSDGSDLGLRLRRVGYAYRSAGENIALGRFQTGGGVVEMWYNSPGHKANMLDPAVNEAGLGIAPGNNGRNNWVLVLGRR